MKEIKACVHRSRIADAIAALKDRVVKTLSAALSDAARTGQRVAGWISAIDVVSATPTH